MNDYSDKTRQIILIGIACALLLTGLLLPAFDQPDGYHQWADQRALASIPSAGDVLSNIGFLAVGAAGLLMMKSGWIFVASRTERRLWGLFFIGLMATAGGSGYYHWTPTDATLVWDRAAMALTFSALFSALVAERINPRVAAVIFPLLLVYALASILYWYSGRLTGAGDLRAYAMLQAALFLLIPAILRLYPGRYRDGGYYLLALASYALALLSEHLDREIFIATGVISGHSLKHLIAALAAGWLLLMLRRRRLHS